MAIFSVMMFPQNNKNNISFDEKSDNSLCDDGGSQFVYDPHRWYALYEQINILENEKHKDIWYIKTETGNTTHVAIDGITFCHCASGLISHRSRFFSHSKCYYCFGNAIQYINNENRSFNRSFNLYNVWWRCSSIVVNPGKTKKRRRCTNQTYSADESLCTQHEKCFLKYFRKYISVCDEVSKIIINYL